MAQMLDGTWFAVSTSSATNSIRSLYITSVSMATCWDASPFSLGAHQFQSAQRLANNPRGATDMTSQVARLPTNRGGDQPPPSGDLHAERDASGCPSVFIGVLSRLGDTEPARTEHEARVTSATSSCCGELKIEIRSAVDRWFRQAIGNRRLLLVPPTRLGIPNAHSSDTSPSLDVASSFPELPLVTRVIGDSSTAAVLTTPPKCIVTHRARLLHVHCVANGLPVSS